MLEDSKYYEVFMCDRLGCYSIKNHLYRSNEISVWLRLYSIWICLQEKTNLMVCKIKQWG